MCVCVRACVSVRSKPFCAGGRLLRMLLLKVAVGCVKWYESCRPGCVLLTRLDYLLYRIL